MITRETVNCQATLASFPCRPMTYEKVDKDFPVAARYTTSTQSFFFSPSSRVCMRAHVCVAGSQPAFLNLLAFPRHVSQQRGGRGQHVGAVSEKKGGENKMKSVVMRGGGGRGAAAGEREGRLGRGRAGK